MRGAADAPMCGASRLHRGRAPLVLPSRSPCPNLARALTGSSQGLSRALPGASAPATQSFHVPSGRSSLPLHSGYGALWSARSSGSLTGSLGCHSARRGPRRGHGAAAAASSLPLCSAAVAAALTAAAGGAPRARTAAPPRRLPARQPRLLLPAQPAAPARSLFLRPRSTTGGGSSTSSGRRPGNSSAAEARGPPTGSGSTAPGEGAGRGRGGAGRDAGPGRRARREDAAGRRRQAPPRKARQAGKERGWGDLSHPGPGAVLRAWEPLPPRGDSAGAPLGAGARRLLGAAGEVRGRFPAGQCGARDAGVRGERCWSAGPPPARRPAAVSRRGSAAELPMPPASLFLPRRGRRGRESRRVLRGPGRVLREAWVRRVP